jgi:glutathione synthase/RimK-type ligase-like ATP-grasp enzyme
MKIGLLLNSNIRLNSYGQKYQEIIIRNNIPFMLIDPNSDSLLDDLKECSHLLFRHSMGDTDKLIYETIFNIAHYSYHIKCFPNFETFWPHENKIREYYLLKSHGFPVVDSHIFWHYDKADAFLRTTQFPIVAKLPKGASSSNVVMVNSITEGKKIINQVFKKGVKASGLKIDSNLSSLSKLGIYKYSKEFLKSQLLKLGFKKYQPDYPEWQIQKDSILFQKFLPDNSFDTRVTVIGKRAFAFRRFVRKDDFRASGSGNFDLDPKKVDTRCLKIAFDVSKKMNFNTMAYDFIYNEDKKPNINEISYGFIDTVVQNCPGFWDDNLLWHDGQNWPQYYQLSDFLLINDLETI